jgi:3-hydroxybutyryl-CoA dehydrogenase
VPASQAEAIVGTNTSSISITRLAASTDRPEKFIGMHFMNPVPLMELVEMIRGIATDDATFEAVKLHHQARQDRPRSPRISPPSSSTASCCR